LIDRFSIWLEAVPITADTVARFFFTAWISRFGSSKIITTDQGAQLELSLNKALTRLIDTKRTRATAYHPESNGLVEHWHRSLKAAIMCQTNAE